MKTTVLKDHVSTLVKIFCAVFLVGCVILAFSRPVHDALDEWMDDIHHQIYTVIALSLIVMVSWIVWRMKK